MAGGGNFILWEKAEPQCEPKFGTVNGDTIILLNGGTEPVPATDINGQPILDGANVITIFNNDGTLQGVMQNQGSYCTIATADGVDKEGITYSAGEVIEVFSDGSIDADKHSDNYIASASGTQTNPNNGATVTWGVGDTLIIDAQGDIVVIPNPCIVPATISGCKTGAELEAEATAALAGQPLGSYWVGSYAGKESQRVYKSTKDGLVLINDEEYIPDYDSLLWNIFLAGADIRRVDNTDGVGEIAIPVNGATQWNFKALPCDRTVRVRSQYNLMPRSDDGNLGGRIVMEVGIKIDGGPFIRMEGGGNEVYHTGQNKESEQDITGSYEIVIPACETRQVQFCLRSPVNSLPDGNWLELTQLEHDIDDMEMK